MHNSFESVMIINIVQIKIHKNNIIKSQNFSGISALKWHEKTKAAGGGTASIIELNYVQRQMQSQSKIRTTDFQVANELQKKKNK